MDNTVKEEKNPISVLYRYLDDKYSNSRITTIPVNEIKTAYDKMMNDLNNNKNLSQDIRNKILNIAYASSGCGGYFNQLQTFMTCLDRYKTSNVTPMAETSGVTFITRPRLCLQSSNIRNNRILTALDTLNKDSMAFAIRNLLDTNFGKANSGRYNSLVSNSYIFDHQNPFFVPLCNALTSISGWPDITLNTGSTDGGFMAEAQSFVTGGDNLQRGGYSFTLNFKDVQYGPIMAIFLYWIEYMRCVTRGSLLAYADDIDAQRMNYTVSIYRFLLDPSKQYITKYAKATGCFPTALPIGGSFNTSQGETFVSNSTNFSIPFTVNKIEYMDYAILMDFNTLVRRYCPDINKSIKQKKETIRVPKKYNVTQRLPNGRITTIEKTTYTIQEVYTPIEVESTSDPTTGTRSGDLKCPTLPINPMSNWMGIPYITSDRNGFKLEYRQHANSVYGKEPSIAEQLMLIDMQSQIQSGLKDFAAISNSYTPEYTQKSNQYGKETMQDFIKKAFDQQK